MWYSSQKWTNAKKQTYGGQNYQSGFEAGYAMELDLRLKAGEITKWERQVKIPLDVNGYHITNYFIDFIVYYPDGMVEYVETKGYETDVWKMKWKLFEALYSEKPDVRITLVKQAKAPYRWTKKDLRDRGMNLSTGQRLPK